MWYKVPRTLYYVLLHLRDTLFCWNIKHTIVCQMYSFARLDLPENKHDRTRAWIRLASEVRSEVWVTIRIKEARWEPGGRMPAPVIPRTDARGGRDPEGRAETLQSRHTTQAVNTGVRLKSRHLKVTQGCEEQKHVAGRHLIGRFLWTMFALLLSYSG